MKNTKLGHSKLSAFLTGKGFYIAICACILVVGATALLVINSTRSGISEKNNSNVSIDTGSNEWSFSVETVDESTSGVPKESSAPDSSAAESESSAEETAVPSEPESQASEPEEEDDPVFSNAFVLPLKGEILNGFSSGKPVKSRTMNDWRTHDGVDIKAPIATPVKSSSDGIVTSIEQDPLWGVCIEIDHGGGYQTMYKGLNVNVSVRKGERVDIGTVLGSVGETAVVEIGEEPHLHFAMKKDGEWIDPMEVIQQL